MSAKVLVNDATPIDVLQMAVLAVAHEPAVIREPDEDEWDFKTYELG
jgi:hypothetical protein